MITQHSVAMSGVDPIDPISKQVEAVTPQERREIDVDALIKDEEDKLRVFSTAKPLLKQLSDTWREEINRCKARRDLREMPLDVKNLRETGKILADETFIPIRVINENIKREMPMYTAFLTQPTELITFTDVLNPATNTAKMAGEFTRGMKYIGWDSAWTNVADGGALHGYDWLEVVFDPSKPLHVAIEHVGSDNLFFALDCEDIQSSPFVLRRYKRTKTQLRSYVKNLGWNKVEVENCILKAQENAGVFNIDIVKVYIKLDGIVYVAWANLSFADDWLCAPKPLCLGIRELQNVQKPNPQHEMVKQQLLASLPPVVSMDDNAETVVTPITELPPSMMAQLPPPTITMQEWVDVIETDYPYYSHRYNSTENPIILETKGRAFEDLPKQEASTALLTAFINAATRASSVYGAPTNQADGNLAVSEIKLKSGSVMNAAMTFFSPPMPDAQATLSALSWLDSKNLSEQGQMTEALRRKRGEKTATEFDMAQQDAAFLQSTPMTKYSTLVRQTYTAAFRIIQSRAAQGLIPFCLLSEEKTPDDLWQNDMSIVNRRYELRAAGDAEVVQKAQKIQRMMQLWPMLANTPMAMPFLIDLLRLLTPDLAPKYEQLANMGQMDVSLVQSLSAVIMGMLKDNKEIILRESPEDRAALEQLLAQAQQYIAAKTGQQNATGTQQNGDVG